MLGEMGCWARASRQSASAGGLPCSSGGTAAAAHSHRRPQPPPPLLPLPCVQPPRDSMSPEMKARLRKEYLSLGGGANTVRAGLCRPAPASWRGWGAGSLLARQAGVRADRDAGYAARHMGQATRQAALLTTGVLCAPLACLPACSCRSLAAITSSTSSSQSPCWQVGGQAGRQAGACVGDGGVRLQPGTLHGRQAALAGQGQSGKCEPVVPQWRLELLIPSHPSSHGPFTAHAVHCSAVQAVWLHLKMAVGRRRACTLLR